MQDFMFNQRAEIGSSLKHADSLRYTYPSLMKIQGWRSPMPITIGVWYSLRLYGATVM